MGSGLHGVVGCHTCSNNSNNSSSNTCNNSNTICTSRSSLTTSSSTVGGSTSSRLPSCSKLPPMWRCPGPAAEPSTAVFPLQGAAGQPTLLGGELLVDCNPGAREQ